MAITRFGVRSVKGQTRFRGNPKSVLQINLALNTVDALVRMCSISPYTTTFYCQVLVNSRHRRWLFQPHLSPLILYALTTGNANLERDKRCRAVSNTLKSPASPCLSPAYLLQLHSNYPCWIATPNHTWFWDALPLSPLVSPSHCLVLIEYTDNTSGMRHPHTLTHRHTVYSVGCFFVRAVCRSNTVAD